MTDHETETIETTETEPSVAVNVAAETMLADLMSAVVDELKLLPDCWQKLSEKKQDDALYRIEHRLRANISMAVSIIAADGRAVIDADVEQVVFKDGIKCVLKLGMSNPARHDLADAVGHPVLIVVGDDKQFMGGELPRAEPDQSDLPIADAGETAADHPSPEPVEA